VPDLDFTVRATLEQLNAPVVIPAMYDQLTSDQRARVRDEYARRQGGRCHYCDQPLYGPPSDEVQRYPVTEHIYPRGFFTWPQHLHHSHRTGLTIGTVHARCNAVLFEKHGE
jgi:hypothetical protein